MRHQKFESHARTLTLRILFIINNIFFSEINFTIFLRIIYIFWLLCFEWWQSRKWWYARYFWWNINIFEVAVRHVCVTNLKFFPYRDENSATASFCQRVVCHFCQFFFALHGNFRFKNDMEINFVIIFIYARYWNNNNDKKYIYFQVRSRLRSLQQTQSNKSMK